MIKAGYDDESWYIAIPKRQNQELTMICYLNLAIEDMQSKGIETGQLEDMKILVEREISTIN